MKKPEIHLHSEFMFLFENSNIKFTSYGSSGPDFIVDDFSCLGEVKKEESNSALKSAFKEIRDRKKKWVIDNYNLFFIVTPKFIRVYKTEEVIDWNNPSKNKCVVFSQTKLDRLSFIEYIKNNGGKLKIETHLEYALNFLMSNKISVQNALSIIKNVNTSYIEVKDGIYLNAGTKDELYIEGDKNTITTFMDKFYYEDLNVVRSYIKHNYSSHLPDSKKSNLGKYYTPDYLVKQVKEYALPYISQDTYVLDLACGCGAFLELFDDCHIIGRDIDSEAVDILNLLEFSNIEKDNSLINVKREKYSLTDTDKLVIVGNPPYNDINSKSKRFGNNSKTKIDMSIDEDIKASDLGRSFLKAYAKLNPECICVLHPLAYLIKESNFKNLGTFFEKYTLEKAVIFSSKEFQDLKKNKSEFPVVCALYKRGSMVFSDVTDFKFDMLNSETQFCLADYETIDKYIRKYPTKLGSTIMKSDIDLYLSLIHI